MFPRHFAIADNGIQASVAYEDAAGRDIVKTRGYRWNPTHKHWEKRLLIDRRADEVAALVAAGFGLLAGTPNDAAQEIARRSLPDGTPLALLGAGPSPDWEMAEHWKVEPVGAPDGQWQIARVVFVGETYRSHQPKR